MNEKSILELIQKLDDEIHINGLAIEDLRDYTHLISENTTGAHRRIDELEEEINRIRRY